MHYIFHLSLLKQDITKKEKSNKNITRLEFEAGNSKEYEVKAIRNSTVYEKMLESGQQPKLHYLILWRGYPKEENTWKLSLRDQHFWKMISSFQKNHRDKPITTFSTVITASPMATPLSKSTGSIKQIRNRPAKTKANK